MKIRYNRVEKMVRREDKHMSRRSKQQQPGCLMTFVVIGGLFLFLMIEYPVIFFLVIVPMIVLLILMLWERFKK